MESFSFHRRLVQSLNYFSVGFTTTSEAQYESNLSYSPSAGGAKARRAFTLVELMVVLAIIVTISAIVLSSQSSFNKTLILANTSYDIALTLRSAQTFGLSSRALATSANAGYGLHFQTGSPGSYLLFADISPVASCTAPDCKAGDHAYTNGADTLVQTYALGNNMSVTDFCAFSSGSWTCAVGGGLTSLDIVFARPNPDAFMSANGVYSAVFPVTKACITITSPQGGARFISVAESGQIVANAVSDPASCHE